MALVETSRSVYTDADMENCVFCRIIKREIPAKIEKETESLLVFSDISPKAPIHLLLVPKTHYRDITEADEKIWEEIRKVALDIAKEKNIKGFRLVHNAGEAAIVPHMHVHLLGGVKADREV